jgi:8-oxo-dGTP diphosphatase
MRLPPIRAAGGVLWDTIDGVTRVALVHRPRYDDWSFPKGKLNNGEHVLLGAIREVVEETGYNALVGRALGETRYMKQTSSGLAQKVVHYWAMRAVDGKFTPGDEVDEVLWLRPRDAARLLTQERDGDILANFTRTTVETTPLLVLRHASAGQRGAFTGDDRERPLDETGVRQAEALVPLLASYGIERVLSADVLRCIDTVRPFAAAHGITVENEPLFSETGFPANRDAALPRIAQVVSSRQPTVLCSQGGVIGELITALCKTYGHRVPSDPGARKGTFWILHLAGDELVAMEKQSALP